MKIKRLGICCALLLLVSISSWSIAGGVKLYALDRDSGDLAEVNPQTGVLIGSPSPLTLSGFVVSKGLGMALDPSDFTTVYAVIEDDASNRRLVTLDLNTAVATDVGLLSDLVAAITFDDTGQLWGVTGDGATDSETLFTINKTTAVMTQVTALGDGTDGETIAFNYDNDLLYTRSGNEAAFPGQALTSIDPSNPIPTTIVISSADGFGEPTGLVYDEDTGMLLEADRQERLMGINVSTGVFTEIAPAVQGGPTLRGLMFFPSKQDLIFYDGVNLNNAP